MALLTPLQRPAFGSHGRKVIAGLCGWEILALAPGSPVPTISSTVDRFPALGLVLLGFLAHHFYLERPAIGEFVRDALEVAENAGRAVVTAA